MNIQVKNVGLILATLILEDYSRICPRKNKNLLMNDLQDMIDARLEVMMSRNPLRIDYYERYQTSFRNTTLNKIKPLLRKHLSI